MKKSFNELNLTNQISRALTELGFEFCTPIQAEAIPAVLEGRDVIGHSETGSGKTAAFGVPSIMLTDPALKKPQVIILCPTRELAMQSAQEIRKFGKFTQGAKTACVYGGENIDRQIMRLREGAQIIIGTPGRVLDHIRRRTLKLDNIKLAVLDEADEMLNMGFIEDIEKVLQQTPEERQTLLFSATINKNVLRIAEKYLKSPNLIKTANDNEITVSTIKQYYVKTDKDRKKQTQKRLLASHAGQRSIIFCNTKKQVDELTSYLKRDGFFADCIHGDMKQTARSAVMKKFKMGMLNTLVATDVAARGIDAADVDLVFNYDIPDDLTFYVHRIGRTGRAGKSGKAYTLVCGGRQMSAMSALKKFVKSEITEKKLNEDTKIQEKPILNKSENIIERIVEAIELADLTEQKNMVDALIEKGYDAKKIACAALKML